MGSLDKGSNVQVTGTVGTNQYANYTDENGNKLTIYSQARQYTATVGNQATPVVAAVTGKKIRVLSWAISESINGPSSYLRDGTTGAQISELVLRNISGATVAVNYQRSAYYPIHLFETSAGNPLILNCSATGTCSVQVVYVLV
jgi:hypothetical protein